MYELVYNSIADPQDIDEADLMGILAVSRQHNQLRGITGFLLYHRGEFVQLLEGEERHHFQERTRSAVLALRDL